MTLKEQALEKHYEWKGKIEVVATVPVSTKDDLSLAYTPGVAQPCLEIQKDVNKSYELTRRHTSAPSSPTAPPFWGWGTSAPRPGCPSWRASAFCSRPSAG